MIEYINVKFLKKKYSKDKKRFKYVVDKNIRKSETVYVKKQVIKRYTEAIPVPKGEHLTTFQMSIVSKLMKQTGTASVDYRNGKVYVNHPEQTLIRVYYTPSYHVVTKKPVYKYIVVKELFDSTSYKRKIESDRSKNSVRCIALGKPKQLRLFRLPTEDATEDATEDVKETIVLAKPNGSTVKLIFAPKDLMHFDNE